MYIFKEFNQTNSAAVRSSLILYFVTLFASLSTASVFFGSAEISLELTIVALAAAHLYRISQLTVISTTRLTRLQYGVVATMALLMVFLISFAFASTKPSGYEFSWQSFKAVLLSLLLAVYLSAYVDFAVVSLFRRST